MSISVECVRTKFGFVYQALSYLHSYLLYTHLMYSLFFILLKFNYIYYLYLLFISFIYSVCETYHRWCTKHITGGIENISPEVYKTYHRYLFCSYFFQFCFCSFTEGFFLCFDKPCAIVGKEFAVSPVG